MQMKRISINAMALALLLFVSVFFSACRKSNKPVNPFTDDKPVNPFLEDETLPHETEERHEETDVPEQTEELQETEPPTTKPTASFDLKNAGLKAEKVSGINKYFTKCDGGLYYRDDSGKYGLMTLNGKKDTGAVYEYIRSEKKYFIAYTSLPSAEDDFAGLNSASLIDAEGNMVIPDHYAAFDVIKERFVRVIEVTGFADSKDDALFYVTDKQFSFSASDDDTLYKGNWFIYDLETGKKMEGVTGTQAYRPDEYGNVLEYTLDDKSSVYMTANGDKLPDRATVFQNGCYVLSSDETIGVYNPDGSDLFTVNRDDFNVTASFGVNYFLGNKYTDGETTYFLVDRTGKIVSAEFKGYISEVGDYLKVENSLYDYDGNKLNNDAYSNIMFEDRRGVGYLLWNDEQVQLLASDGTEICTKSIAGDISVSQSYFTIKNGDTHYCWKDDDFTIKGRAIYGALVISEGEKQTKDLIDTVTGDTILSGYDDYDIVGDLSTGLYVYAQKNYSEYDVYLLN